MELHHLAFRTGDVAALASFYEDVFGWKIVRRTLPRSIWLAVGADSVLMIEAREADEPAARAGTLDVAVFRVDEDTRAAIRRKSIELGCHDGETGFTVYLRDPDGRRLGVSTFDLALPPGGDGGR